MFKDFTMFRESKYFINKNGFNLHVVKKTIEDYCNANDIEIDRLLIKEEGTKYECLYYRVYGHIAKLNKIKEYINVMNFNK
jgi:hypothetical protein